MKKREKFRYEMGLYLIWAGLMGRGRGGGGRSASLWELRSPPSLQDINMKPQPSSVLCCSSQSALEVLPRCTSFNYIYNIYVISPYHTSA